MISAKYYPPWITGSTCIQCDFYASKLLRHVESSQTIRIARMAPSEGSTGKNGIQWPLISRKTPGNASIVTLTTQVLSSTFSILTFQAGSSSNHGTPRSLQKMKATWQGIISGCLSEKIRAKRFCSSWIRSSSVKRAV
jgi:hypothetical protein